MNQARNTRRSAGRSPQPNRSCAPARGSRATSSTVRADLRTKARAPSPASISPSPPTIAPRSRSTSFQLQQAITVAGAEIADAKQLGAARLAQAASDAAYELGLALFDARTAPSSFDEGQRADVRGIVDAIEACDQAFGDAPPAALADATSELEKIKARVSAAPSMAKLAGRAELGRATGVIGLAIRRAGVEKGYRLRPPYRLPDGAADASISCLTLPPPRVPIPPPRSPRSAWRLFEDTRLSPNDKRACSTCHDAKHGYAEARPTPETLDAATPLVRNTPTLLYDGLAATQLWDGRIVTAETQALRVIHNRAELGLSDAELVARVAAEPSYVAAFAALPEHEITPQTIGKALGAYVATLGSGTSPVDAFARGDDAALSSELAHGLDVFAGVGRCARCHVPPLWGGSRPTDFAVPIYANVGTTAGSGRAELDHDIGRAGVSKRERDRGSFKTPTLRDLAKTAPFMHNGRFATLEQVVDFYDQGGRPRRRARRPVPRSGCLAAPPDTRTIAARLLLFLA